MPDNKPIDSMQIKLIHIAKGKLGLSEEDYRAVLSERYWVNTCKDLSYDEATELIKYFQTQGFKIITRRRGERPFAPTKGTNIVQIVNAQQLAKIEHLRADIRWRLHDGFYRWLAKWLKTNTEGKTLTQIIQTSANASRVIEGLKGMLARQEKTDRMEKNAGNCLRRDGGMHGGHYQW